MKRGRLILLAVLIGAAILLMPAPARADRGGMVMRPVTMKENIDVYDAGQKAIICWQDGVELMILSTDKYTSQKAKVLEFLPLPSKPDRVEKADVKVFQGVARLIRSHRPRVRLHSDNGHLRSKSRNGHGTAAPEQAVKIVFHKKIGAHDITIGHVLQMNGFRGWVKKFVTRQGMQYREEDVNRLEPVVKSYLNRGYSYFVFDVVELSPDKQSIEPVLYRFKCPRVYFPLEVTTLSRGTTNIALYLFTKFKTDIWGTRSGFVSGFYQMLGKVSYNHPIKFQVQPYEVQTISKEIHNFMFPGNNSKAEHGKIWFSTAKFKGPTKDLTRDFIMKPRR